MNTLVFKIRNLGIILLLMPVTAFAQEEKKDSVSYEGRYIRVEVVNVKKDKENLTNKSSDQSVGDRDSMQTDDNSPAQPKMVLTIFEEDVEETESGNTGMINDTISSNDLVETNFLVMDIGFNNMLNADKGIKMPEDYKQLKINTARSVNFHLGIVQQGIRLDGQGKLRLVYGVGMEYNNYHFINDVDLESNQDVLTYTVNTERDYKKNKVVTQYVTMPLMLNFKTNPKNESKSLNIAAGVQAGYLFRSQQKQKWDEDGDTRKSKIRSDYNFNEFRYGYVVQFGYGNFNIYTKYYPTPVFRDGEGPEMNTAAVGLVLVPF